LQMGRKEAMKLKLDPTALADMPDCPMRMRPCPWQRIHDAIVDSPPAPLADEQYPEVTSAITLTQSLTQPSP